MLWLRAIGVWLVIVVLTVGLGIPAIVLVAIHPSGYYTMRFGRWWARGILAAAGVRVDYRGLEHIPRGPAILVSNHLSFLDVWALIPVLPDAAMFAAKASLFRVPVLGLAMRVSGFVPVDRRNRARAIETLNQAAERIRAGRPLVMFPEGTRSRTGRLGRFKKGAFVLAVRAQVPLVPVAVSGSGRLMPADSWRIRPGRMRLEVLPPVGTRDLTEEDVDALVERVRSAIASRLDPDELEPDERPAAAPVESRA